ncbi:hypothetical protein KAI78_06295 [bacterium]|nr:hypothetical protein [bacterium]
MRRCKSCLAVDAIEEVRINKDGRCSFCSGESHFGVLKDPQVRKQYEEKDRLYAEFLKKLKDVKGSGKYDCILAYSGGKDSTYLMKFLLDNSDLRILAVTVDNGLESDVALKNIERIKELLPIDHRMLKDHVQVSLKVYRKLLTSEYEKNSVDRICRVCTVIWQSALLKTAVEEKVPMIILGYSPDQIEYYFYKIADTRLRSDWFPDELLKKEDFTGPELETFWNGADTKDDDIPEVFLPFHVFPEYSPDKIRQELKDSGLLSKGNSSQLVTNCKLNWLMIYRDYKNLGYNSHLPSFSFKIRKGMENRFSWRVQLAMAKLFIGNAIVPRKVMKHTLKKLGLTFSDLTKS